MMRVNVRNGVYEGKGEVIMFFFHHNLTVQFHFLCNFHKINNNTKPAQIAGDLHELSHYQNKSDKSYGKKFMNVINKLIKKSKKLYRWKLSI